MKSYKILFASVGIVVSSLCSAATLWDEGVNGDISNDRLHPSSATAVAGSNLLKAVTMGGDLEYLTVIVPTGHVLSKIVVDSYQSNDQRMFIGVQAGSTFTESNFGTNVANILGYTHFGTAVGNVGTDILDDMGTGAGAIGFTPPLASGPYTFWIQQLGATTTFQLNYVVTAVPEPSVFALFGTAIGILLIRSRRK